MKNKIMKVSRSVAARAAFFVRNTKKTGQYRILEKCNFLESGNFSRFITKRFFLVSEAKKRDLVRGKRTFFVFS